MELSWKPVRNGDVYCSPACGANCRYSEFERCRKAAEELCAKLGKGWNPFLWENMGWYWRVENGKIEIRQRTNPDWEYCASYDHGHPHEARTPKGALKKLHKYLQDDLDDLEKSVKEIKKAIND